MATKIEKMQRRLNDEFRDDLAAAMLAKFKIETVTEFNFFAGRLFTKRKDEADFTPEQMAFAEAFEAGYQAAREKVRE